MKSFAFALLAIAGAAIGVDGPPSYEVDAFKIGLSKASSSRGYGLG